MFARSKLIGTAVFSRLEPAAFTGVELAVLSDISRALAAAVANARANEEIRKLHDQLAAENIALRARNSARRPGSKTSSATRRPFARCSRRSSRSRRRMRRS